MGAGLHDDTRLGAAAASSLLLLSPVALALALVWVGSFGASGWADADGGWQGSPASPCPLGMDSCARVLLLSLFSQI